MNYYIDFDNTIYETAKLTKSMLDTIVNKISEHGNVDLEKLVQETKNNFNSTSDNIFEFATKMAEKYNVNAVELNKSIKNIIDDGKKFVFDDAKRFLEKLKDKNHKIILLTFLPQNNQNYQIEKIQGSGLTNYFDSIIMTTEYKFKLDINYQKGIFIDDDPRDLKGLFEKNAFRVIRIRKENNRRSKIDIDNSNIEEYKSFDNICID